MVSMCYRPYATPARGVIADTLMFRDRYVGVLFTVSSLSRLAALRGLSFSPRCSALFCAFAILFPVQELHADS